MPAIDNGAADRDAVPTDPFGDGMHHDIGAQAYRLAQIRRGECVVYEKRNACVMGNLRNARDVENFKTGISDGFGDDEPRVRPNGGCKAFEIARTDEARADPEPRQRVRQQSDGAAIKRNGSYDMIACAQERRDG